MTDDNISGADRFKKKTAARHAGSFCIASVYRPGGNEDG